MTQETGFSAILGILLFLPYFLSAVFCQFSLVILFNSFFDKISEYDENDDDDDNNNNNNNNNIAMDAERPLPFPHSPPSPGDSASSHGTYQSVVNDAALNCSNANSNSLINSNGPMLSLELLLRRAREKLRKATRNNKKMAPVRSIDADEAQSARVHGAIMREMDEQRRQGMFVDLTLVVGGREGGAAAATAATAGEEEATKGAALFRSESAPSRSFPVHRSVVAAASPFFRAMLSVKMKECEQDVIELKDVDVDAMELALDYIYSGKLPSISWSSLMPLLLLSNMLQIGHLERECRDILEELLHELHRWIFSESPSKRSSSLSTDDDLMMASIKKENELREAAIGRESMEFLLDVLFMFEEFPVVFTEEEPSSTSSSSSSSTSPSSSPSSPVAAGKAMRNLCCKILRFPKVLKLLAQDCDELLQRIDLAVIEYLVKCPGALYGSPSFLLQILVKKFLCAFVSDAGDLSDDALQQLLHQWLQEKYSRNDGGKFQRKRETKEDSFLTSPPSNVLETLREHLEWFVKILQVVPPQFTEEEFLLSEVFGRIRPHTLSNSSSSSSTSESSPRITLMMKFSLNVILQIKAQAQPQPFLCYWTRYARQLWITEPASTEKDVDVVQADRTFEVPHPNSLEMIHMESSMRLWSGCYKSSWLKVEELGPSAYVNVKRRGGRGGREGGGGGEAAFEILRVFLGSLNDGKTQEIKVHICGFDPISNSWISVGDDATLCYKHQKSLDAASSTSSSTSPPTSNTTEDSLEIVDVLADASSDGRRIYVGVNIDAGAKHPQKSLCHVLAFESTSSGNSNGSNEGSVHCSIDDPFKYALRDKYTKRRHRLQGLVVTSGPRGDEVLLFGDAFSGSVRYPTTHSLLYWCQDVGVAGGGGGEGGGRGGGGAVERSRQPRPEISQDLDGICGMSGAGGGRSGVSFQAVAMGEWIYCLIFDAGRGAEPTAWKYGVVADCWTRLRVPEMAGNLAFVNILVDDGIFLTQPRTASLQPQQPRSRLALIYAQRKASDEQHRHQKYHGGVFKDEAAFYGLVGDPNRREFGGFHLIESAGGGGGGDDWNPFAEQQKDKLLRFVSSVCQRMDDEVEQMQQTQYEQRIAIEEAGQPQPEVYLDSTTTFPIPRPPPQTPRSCVESVVCLSSFHSFASTEKKMHVPPAVWYFHDEPKSRLTTRLV